MESRCRRASRLAGALPRRRLSALAPALEMRTIRGMTEDFTQSTMRRQPLPHPFRGAVVRGLAVLCPPLLTVLIIVWVVSTTKSYFLEPVMAWARQGMVWAIADVRESTEADDPLYHRLDNGTSIPRSVYDKVYAAQKLRGEPLPTTGEGYYRCFVDLTYLRPLYAIPLFLSVFILLLYFLGKFMAAGIGRFSGNVLDHLVLRVPGVRAVYSATKQVSDFVFTERDMQHTRIVAVEYPRKGIWSMGFVTGESMAAMHDAANEPVLAVLIPYSPLPVTGCTITVRKSECTDLNITFDQACQFIVSCGVVVPPQQLWHARSEAGVPRLEASQAGS